jgi:hypothetical protein
VKAEDSSREWEEQSSRRRKEFELKKKIPQKIRYRVIENNSHGETSVQTIFRHKAGSKPGYSTHYLLALEGPQRAAGHTKCDKQIVWARHRQSGHATRDAAGHVSRSQPNVSACGATWTCLFRTTYYRDGLTSLRVPFTSSCSRKPSLSPCCFPILAAAGVALRQRRFCCNIRVYRMIHLGGVGELSSGTSPTQSQHPK